MSSEIVRTFLCTKSNQNLEFIQTVNFQFEKGLASRLIFFFASGRVGEFFSSRWRDRRKRRQWAMWIGFAFVLVKFFLQFFTKNFNVFAFILLIFFFKFSLFYWQKIITFFLLFWWIFFKF